MYLELPLYAMKKIYKEQITPWNTFVKLSLNKKTNLQEMEFSFLSSQVKNDKQTVNSNSNPNSNSKIDLNLIDFSISTLKQDLHSLRSMSDYYVKSLKREFTNHPSELGTDNK